MQLSTRMIQRILRRRLSSAVLSHEQYGNPNASKKAVFIHGMLGSKKNMRTPCKTFIKEFPDYSCFTVDLRGHGDSHELGGDNTILECAHDIHKLFPTKPPDFICAHSMGGKVALMYLELLKKEARSLPDNTWILDSLPGLYQYEDHMSDAQSVQQVVTALDKIPLYFENRRWVVSELGKLNIPLPIAQWLSTSVVDTPQGCKFAFDKEVVHQLFRNFCESDMWQFLEEYDDDKALHFVRAGRQNKWTEFVLSKFADISKKNPAVRVHTMPNVGHWLHAEDLPGLMRIIIENNEHR